MLEPGELSLCRYESFRRRWVVSRSDVQPDGAVMTMTLFDQDLCLAPCAEDRAFQPVAKEPRLEAFAVLVVGPTVARTVG